MKENLIVNSLILEFDRIPETLKRSGKSHSSLYRAINAKLWTPPVKIGAKSAAHPRHEVDAIMAAELNGASEDELRALVVKLMALRKDLLARSAAA